MPQSLPVPALVEAPPWIWGAFLLLIIGVLTIDNLLVDRKAHKVAFKEAMVWSGIWIGLAVLFGVWLAYWKAAGPSVASKFAAGYLLELSLSVDNLFVFILIFTQFKVPETLHHKVLNWGIYGALILRGLFIGAGAALVSRFSWILYLFGAFLLYTGIKLLFHEDEAGDPKDSSVFKAAHKIFKVTKNYEGNHFFVNKAGTLNPMLLFIIVLIVEATDVVFAVDSIPAVFGITQDPFIVYTSNIFAILGLRSMFFALEGVMHLFRFLKVGLSVILSLIGLKLLFLHLAEAKFGFHAGEFWILGLIVLILLGSIVASLIWPAKKKASRAKKH